MWYVAPLEMNEGNSLGQGYNRPTSCSAEKDPHATFNFNFNFNRYLYYCALYSLCCLLQDETLPADGSDERRNASEYRLNNVTWCIGGLPFKIWYDEDRQSR